MEDPLKKRKLDQVDDDSSEQGYHPTKKQKLGEADQFDLPEARDVFDVTKSIPTWTLSDQHDLVARMQRVIDLNGLNEQQKIYGSALQNTLPIAPYNQGRTVFQWFLHNVLPEELQRFERQVIDKTAANVQDPNCWLVHQVSGTSKTKLAYELSTRHYALVVRCLDDAIVADLNNIFQLKLSVYNRLDFDGRKKLPYYALYITYAWLRAHLKFLEFYQKELVTQFDLTETQKHTYFHLIQRSGSPSSKYIAHQFYSQVHFVTHDTDPRATIEQRFEELSHDIGELIKVTNVKAIAFDGLLSASTVGVALFAHNSMLFNDSLADVAASQQLEIRKKFGGASIVSPPNGCKPKEFDRPTSLVNGVMHFVSTFKSCVPFVITGTSKSVLDYFVQYGTRVMPQIGEFVPNAYFGANNLYNLLAHYFGVASSDPLLAALQQFEGRALFFIYHFFFQLLLPALEKHKPSSSDEVEAVIWKLLRTGEAQRGCSADAEEIVKHFYRTMSKEAVQAVEVGVRQCAGWMARQHIEVTRQTKQALAFIQGDKCFVTEPFILEALAHRMTTVGTAPTAGYVTK